MPTLERAVALWRAGDAHQAEFICHSLVHAGGRGASSALGLLAEIYVSTGRPERAIASLQQVVQARPRDAAAHRQLGNLLLARGSLIEAVASYEQALAIEPRNVRASNNLGQALMRLGRTEEAVSRYERAIALDPDYAIAHNNLGIANQAQGHPERAIESYRRALTLEPKLTQAHYNCGNALSTLNRLPEALASYDQAIAQKSDFVEALVSRADTLQRVRRFEAAVPDYERALQLRPGHVEARSNCANALLELKRFQEALSFSEDALRRQPDFAQAHNNRSGALRELYRYEEALAAIDRAVELKPDYIEALCNRGKLLREMGEHEAATDSFERAAGLDPDHLEARLGALMCRIPVIPAEDEQVVTSREAFDAALNRFAAWVDVGGCRSEASAVGALQPFFLAYQEFSNKELLARYGSLCSQLMSAWQQRRALVSADMVRSSSTIRLGIVSAHVRDHSVYRALTKGWLDQLDRTRFAVGVFHVGVQQDSETAWARDHSDFFIGGDRTLAEWVEVIKTERVDVLLFPEIGMDPTTLRLASLRLAPCQMAAWGHPETTGLPTIDYYLSAQLFEPPAAQDHYTERLVALPHLGVYCEPEELPASDLDVRSLGISGDRPVLLCPGMPFKYAPQHDHVLAEIARRSDVCQLIFFEPPGTCLSRKLRDRLAHEFRLHDLDPARYLVFLPWLGRPDFGALMKQADGYLDTLGFSGFNTVMQAIECDLPVVAYEGRFMRGRLASAVMRRIGLPQLVARDPTEYISLACKVAAEGDFRTWAREQIRGGKQVLFRDRQAIQGLEAFLEQITA